jgi:peptidyl-prolyl cis-trans isomerase B (cyclophilin B)
VGDIKSQIFHILETNFNNRLFSSFFKIHYIYSHLYKFCILAFSNGDKMVDHPKVKMETTKGTLIIELYPEHAPGTVANFLKLIKSNFYNGLKFHRVIPKFVIQGGDPKGNGTGGPGWTIKCETQGNPLTHKPGALSMAHAGKDTGGSQFFIVLTREQTKHLDGKHTVFGQVIQGLEFITKIEQGDKMLKVEELQGDAPSNRT